MAAPHYPFQKGSGRRLRAGGAAVGVLLLALFGLWLLVTTGPADRRVGSEEEQAYARLLLEQNLADSLEVSVAVDTSRVRSSVYNASSYAIPRLTLSYALFDSSGARVGSTSTEVIELAPGETASVHLEVTDPGALEDVRLADVDVDLRRVPR
ncbi:MAG: FxLYD domain-containing protein [Rhodothermales bacterium]|nr:FxLYD domain-containing protein [Rhodothermales bacterium]